MSTFFSVILYNIIDMFGLGTKHHKPRINLVISIGSSSVRASFVQDGGKNVRPVILTSHAIKFQADSQSFSRYLASMSRACVQLLQKKIDFGRFHTPDTIFCILEKPWYVAHTHTFSDDREYEFSFEGQRIKEILDGHLCYMDEFVATTPFAKTSTRVIEKRVVHSAVNGYEVDRIPPRNTVKKIDITTYVSVAPDMVLDAVQNAVNKHVKRPVIFATSALATFVVQKNIFQDLDNFLSVVVTESSTEIEYVDQGALHSMSYYMQGLDELEHNDHPAIHTQTLLSRVRLMNVGSLDNTSADVYQKAIADSASRWRASFAQNLNHFAGVGMKSDTVILLVDPEYAAWVQYALTDVRNHHLSRSHAGFHVILITMDVLDDYVGAKVAYPDMLNTLHVIFSYIIS